MKKDEHEKEVKKLTKTELELIDLISKTNDDELMNKFSEWQDQRIICNVGFKSWIEMLLNEEIKQ